MAIPSRSQRLVGALAAAMLLTVAGSLCAQTYLFDFGSSATTTTTGASPDDPLRTWNNITDTLAATNSGQLLDLVTSTNTPSAVDFFMVSRFNWSNTNGTLLSTLYPQDATRDSLYGNTEAFSGGNPAGSIGNVFPSFKLTSLDPGSFYNLTFYASRTGVADNRETLYTVAGLTSGGVSLNPGNNVDSFVTYFNIMPSLAGEISISLSPGAANNNASHFTYLGVLEITTVPEPASALLLLTAVGALGLRRHHRSSTR